MKTQEIKVSYTKGLNTITMFLFNILSNINKIFSIIIIKLNISSVIFN
jgi:hypothetical protein